MNPPTNMNEVCDRLDIIRDRLESTTMLEDRVMWVGMYKKNLVLLREYSVGVRDFSRYALYAVWYSTNTDVEERVRP